MLLALGLGCLPTLCAATSPPAPVDAALLERIDRYVEGERKSSDIPGIAVAIVGADGPAHARGFGHDGRGNPITADTPFPIGSLTKSFTALLVRQAIDVGQLDADAPVQRYLPWFRVADAQASRRITLRHLLNQTSGFSRDDGIAPLLADRPASIEELVRGLRSTSLNRPVGERFEYSNLNYVVLAAVFQASSGRPWGALLTERVLRPLAMDHSFIDRAAAQRAGLTAVHQIVFGLPIERQTPWLAAFEPTGGLISSVHDMARCAQMLLTGGQSQSTRVVSPAALAELLSPASPPSQTRLLSAEFDVRYGEGWFVGAFGPAANARWHLGSLTTFVAWMVLLPETKQAVVVLINANTELPLDGLNATMSRLPIGIVSLLNGYPPPRGKSLRTAYAFFNFATAAALAVVAMLAGFQLRARRAVGSAVMAIGAAGIVVAAITAGLAPSLLWIFAPELAVLVGAVVLLLCLPLARRCLWWRHAKHAGD